MSTTRYAYSRFCREGFPLPSEQQVVALERRIRIGFPENYRNFLLEFNGGYFTEPEITPVVEGCPLDGLTFLNGINAVHEAAELGRPSDLLLFDDNDPPKIVPIGATGMGGLIILVTEKEDRGTIFLKQAYAGFFFLADSIEDFFELLREPKPV
jgi:hypothetical protein